MVTQQEVDEIKAHVEALESLVALLVALREPGNDSEVFLGTLDSDAVQNDPIPPNAHPAHIAHQKRVRRHQRELAARIRQGIADAEADPNA